MRSLRIVIADDHATLRESLSLLLNTHLDMNIIGQADSGERACHLAQELHPDVLIMDVSMPGMGGTAATKRIHSLHPQVKVLALSNYEDEIHIRQLLAAGASGYILKRTAAAEIASAIRIVAQAGLYLSPDAATTLTRIFLKPDINFLSSKLSAREQTTLRLVAQGFTQKEIADFMGVSTKTVETYSSRLKSKLGLQSRGDIVRYAIAKGWLKEAT